MKFLPESIAKIPRRDGGSILEYWYVLRKRVRFFLIFLITAVATTSLCTLLQPKIYKATTRILIERGQRNILSVDSIFSVDSTGLDYYPTQYRILRSRAVAKRVLDHFQLQSQYEWAKDPVGTLLSQVEIEPVKGSRLVDVSFYSTNPKLAAELADGVVRFYIEQNLDSKLQKTQHASGWLEKRIDSMREKLSQSEKELQLFKEKNQSVDFTALERSEDLIQKLQRDISNLKQDLSGLNQRYLPKNPKVMESQSRLQALEGQLQQEINRSVAGGRLLIDYNQFKREAESNRKIYETMLTRLKETTAAEGMEDTNVIVVDRAEIPFRPVSPRVFLNVLLSLLIGVVGGAGLCLAVESLDNTVKSAEDIGAGVPFLGAISHWDIVPGELLYDQMPHNVLEVYRSIRTNLLFSSPDKPLRTLMVTSPQPEDGKTIVACNLALIIAQNGFKVLLIDADLRRPRIHKVFNQSSKAGLTSALITQEGSCFELIQGTPFENLFVLYAGPIPPRPSEILGSKKMRDLILNLRNDYDFIIIDSPPFMPVTDPVALSTHVDGVIMVTRYNKTPRAAIEDGVKKFEKVQAKIAGVILNDVDFTQERYRYSTHYYYNSYQKPIEEPAMTTPRHISF